MYELYKSNYYWYIGHCKGCSSFSHVSLLPAKYLYTYHYPLASYPCNQLWSRAAIPSANRRFIVLTGILNVVLIVTVVLTTLEICVWPWRRDSGCSFADPRRRPGSHCRVGLPWRSDKSQVNSFLSAGRQSNWGIAWRRFCRWDLQDSGGSHLYFIGAQDSELEGKRSQRAVWAYQ